MKVFNVINELGLPIGAVTAEELLSKHTSFKIGGAAEVFAKPATADEMIKIWQACEDNKIPLTILGDGANVLAPDEGLRGVVVTTTAMNAMTVDADNHRIIAAAGVRMAALAAAAMNAQLAGLSFAAGIPGTVGGGVYMNAGAYEGSIGEVVSETRVLAGGEVKLFTKLDMYFDYRHSFLADIGGILLEATFTLQHGDTEEIRAATQNFNRRRRESQPLEFPSAGSTFKRPTGLFAGKLIQDAGLKGHSIGGAEVSTKHAGFIINKGGATAADVKALIEDVRQKVHTHSGVWLEPEVKILGGQ